jgi:hypothetical protein
MNADKELLPCPWCGQPLTEANVVQGSTFRWRVVDGCCTEGPEVRHDTMAADQAAAEADSRARAIEAWNTRATPKGAIMTKDKELLEAAAPDLLRTIEQYEKHGVTCQTYRHFVSAPCAECNAAPQPAAKPVAIVKLVAEGVRAHIIGDVSVGDLLYTHPAVSLPSDVVRNAQRYRWLRNESWAGYNTGKGTPSVYTVDGAGNRRMMLAEEAMDDAIDAAIAAQGEKP